MRTTSVKWLVVATVGVGLLAGCADNNSLRSRLGLLHQGPDRFAVLPNRPLEIPEGAELPVPDPGAQSRVRPDPVTEVREVLGAEVPEANGPSPLEQGLVTQLGVGNAAPIEANSFDSELAALGNTDDDIPLVHQWLNVGEARKRAAHYLDPVAETERLRTAGILAARPELADDGETDDAEN